MNLFAEQFGRLAFASIPEKLLPQGGVATFDTLLPALAPWHSLLFECRLGEAGAPIDVSQQFNRENGGAAALAALAGSRASALADREARAAWARIAALATRWGDDPALEGLADLFLEHDFDAAGRLAPVPALFPAIVPGAELPARDADPRMVALDAVSDGGDERWAPLDDALARAGAFGLVAGHVVGAMLSRRGERRCMVRGIARGDVAGFLSAVGWGGPVAASVALIDALPLDGCDPVLVIGHDGGGWTESCGVEFVFGHDPATGGRARLDRWFVAAGLADAERVAALAQWDGMIDPGNAPADWPDALIAAEISGRRADFPRLRRHVNHAKLNIAQGRAVEAKAYLALEPVSARVDAAKRMPQS